MRKRSNKTTTVVVTRRIFGARSVPKCVLRMRPGPHSGEATCITSSAVPCRKSRPIALLAGPTYSWLSGWPNFSCKQKERGLF